MGTRSGPYFTAPPGQRPARRRVGVVGAYVGGWGWALGAPGVVLLLWIVLMLFAGALSLPAAAVLRDYLAHSTVAERAMDRMPWDVFVELVFGHAATWRAAALGAVPLVVAFLLLSLYLSGGVLERLWDGARRPWSEFFAACHRHVWRLVLVAVLTLMLAAALLGPAHYGSAWLVERFTEDTAGPAPSVYATWAHWAVLLLLASFVARVYDYSRILAVAEPNRPAITAFFGGVAFTLRNGARTLLLWLLLTLTPVAFAAVYGKVSGAIGYADANAMWINVGLGQMLVLLRIVARLATLAGQMQLLMFSRR